MRVIFGIGIGLDKRNDPISRVNADKLIVVAMQRVTAAFGGCFVARGEGAWHNKQTDEFIREPGITITADISIETLGECSTAHAMIRDVAQGLKVLFQQTAIHVTTMMDAKSELV